MCFYFCCIGEFQLHILKKELRKWFLVHLFHAVGDLLSRFSKRRRFYSRLYSFGVCVLGGYTDICQPQLMFHFSWKWGNLVVVPFKFEEIYL